jgi:hypothetical protein
VRRLTSALLLAPLLLVSVACSDADQDPLAGSTEDTEPAGEPATDREPSADVRLLDPGAEPRRVLRLDPPEDCEQRATLTQEQEQSITIGGEEQSSSRAGNAFDLLYRCTEVTDDSIEVRSEYLDARVLYADAASRGTLEDVLDAFEGATGRTEFDHYGGIVDLDPPDIDLDGQLGTILAPMLDGLTDSLRQSAAPFPIEAVGLGGRWEHVAEIEVSGLRMRQITEYTITGIDADLVAADTVVRLEVIPGPMDFSELGLDGATAELVSGGFAGTGTASWDLNGVIAFSEQTIEGTTEMAIQGPGGQEIRLVQDQLQHVTIEPTVD